MIGLHSEEKFNISIVKLEVTNIILYYQQNFPYKQQFNWRERKEEEKKSKEKHLPDICLQKDQRKLVASAQQGNALLICKSIEYIHKI